MLAFSGIENTPIVNTDTERAAANNNNMGGFTEEEGSLVLPDGTSLYTKSWKVCHFLYLLHFYSIVEQIINNALIIARGNSPSNPCVLPWIQ